MSGWIEAALSCTTKANTIDHRFTLTPATGVMSAPECLPLDVDLNLEFERAKPSLFALRAAALKADTLVDNDKKLAELWKTWIAAGTDENIVGTGDKGSTIDKLPIKDVHLCVDYVSSPSLRAAHAVINSRPFCLNYEDINVLRTPVTMESTNVRFNNLIGGNTPTFIFAGLIKSAALDGNLEDSATQFSRHGVKEFDFTLNGVSVNGYPIKSDDKNDWLVAYRRFNEVCSRMHSSGTVSGIDPHVFRHCSWLWSHSFEGESLSTGWIGINFQLEEALSQRCDLIVWTVHPSQLTIDKDHKIKKIIL